jgi:hypothetical protein
MLIVTPLTAARKMAQANAVILVALDQASGSRGDVEGIGSLRSSPEAEMRKTLPAISS